MRRGASESPLCPRKRTFRGARTLRTQKARARFVVLVPDLPGPREMRVRLADARGIADAAIHLAGTEAMSGHEGVGVLAISYAVGLAVLATLPPDAQDKIRFVAVGDSATVPSVAKSPCKT